MGRYINNVNITSGYRLNVQSPIDDRWVIENNADLAQDISTDQPQRWYEGMNVVIISEASQYLWLNQETVPQDAVFYLGSEYTYRDDFPDAAYAGKTFGLFKTNNRVILHSTLNLDDGTNPHGTTKGDVGLGNVDNTSDSQKPVSNPQQIALNAKENLLGNPAENGYVLASTITGTRYWIQISGGISAHSQLVLNDGKNPHGTEAEDVPFTPAGNTTASNVQLAIQEVQTDLDGVRVDGSNHRDRTDNPHNTSYNDLENLPTPIYSGSDLEATILGLNASLYVGQLWWASDTKRGWRATTPNTTGVAQWVGEFIEYVAENDTYQLPGTADGQVQNLGQELFENGICITADTATIEEPKLFGLGAIVTQPFFNIGKLGAAGLSQNALYGLNTTPVNGLNSKAKITTYGRIKNVNTSAWAVNSRLYADVIPGELTSTRPPINIYYIGTVKVQDAVNGEIFVNTIGASREDIATTPISTLRGYFSGNLAPAPAGSFYVTDSDSAAGPDTQQIIDAPQNGTAWIPIDTVGVITTGGVANVGQVNGQIQFLIDSDNGGEQLTMEAYLANEDGTVVDSGSGLPNGDLGVPPIVVLKSPIVSFNNNSTQLVNLSGYIYTEVLIAPTQRIRFHIGASKIGGNASTKEFTIYQGNNHLTYAEVGIPLQASDVNYDNAASTLAATTVQQAVDELDNKKSNLNTQNLFTDSQFVQGLQKAFVVLNNAGDVKGAFGASSISEFNAVVGAIDEDINPLNLAMIGNNVMLGTNGLYIANNNANPYGYLKLGGDPISIDGKNYYNVQFQNIEQTLYQESFGDNTVHSLNSGSPVVILTSSALVNSYTKSGDAAFEFIIEEQSSRSTSFEFWIGLNGVQIGATNQGVVNGTSTITITNGLGLPENVPAGSFITIVVQATQTGDGRNTEIRNDLTSSTFIIRELGFGTDASSTKANRNTVIAVDDSSAASQGVQIGGYYANPDGTIKVRLT